MTRALKAWVVLTAVTLGLAVALMLGEDAVAPKAWIAVAAAASLVKARLILFDYLGLRGCSGWRSGFLAGLVALVVVVYGLIAVG